MSETIVDEPVCPACGAEVRDGSMFCYNCGSAVAGEGAETEQAAEISAIPEPSITPNGEGTKKEILPGSLSGLQTAASMRRRAKPSRSKPREMVWVPRDESVGLQFVAATIAFIVFAVVIVILALYFK
jgi:hypothetical protein